jgi:hypothetical protein
VEGLATAVRAGLAVAVAAAFLAAFGCGGDDSANGGPAVSETRDETRDTTASESEPTVPESPDGSESEAAVPEELVGTWQAESDSAELIYVFARDGAYKHAGVLLQQREAGLFSFEIAARGIVSVEGSELVLTPTEGTQTISDPDVPSANSTRPIDRSPERYGWDLEASGSQLNLTDASGATVSYTRQ